MRKIVHHEIGEPARVLRLEKGEAPPLVPDQVRLRVSYAPIHPGDLLGIMGSPAFGSPPVIGRDGRVPGFEGAGVVTRLGSQVDPTLGLKAGVDMTSAVKSGSAVGFQFRSFSSPRSRRVGASKGDG